MHEGHKKIYDLALTNIKHFGWEPDNAIFFSLNSILSEKSEHEKKDFLGDEIYLDYLVYKKRIEEEKFDSFTTLFNGLLKNYHLESDEKRKQFLRISSKFDSRIRQMIIIGKLAEDYFSKKNLENYINFKKNLK